VKGTQCFRNFSISNDLFTKLLLRNQYYTAQKALEEPHQTGVPRVGVENRAMPLDYSKWDKLDDSDDEEEAKPASPKKVAAALEGNMRANPFPCPDGRAAGRWWRRWRR